MKMKITMYELLGMVKDGKAPKKIKYSNMIWEYDGDYYSSKNINVVLEEYCNLTTSLNDEVEILEEEKKLPEKLEILQFSDLIDMSNDEIMQVIKDQRFKINEIIDYLKSKGE